MEDLVRTTAVGIRVTAEGIRAFGKVTGKSERAVEEYIDQCIWAEGRCEAPDGSYWPTPEALPDDFKMHTGE